MASKKKFLFSLFATVFATVLAAMLAFCVWLLGSESGARSALSALSSVSAGVIDARGVQGRLAGPLHIDRLAIEQPHQRIVLKSMRFDWRPSALLQGLLHIKTLQIEHLTVADNSARSPEPAVLPTRIALPLALRIDHAQIEHGEIERGQDDDEPGHIIQLGTSVFRVDFDRKRYQFDLDQFTANVLRPGHAPIVAHFKGETTLDAVHPYAIRAFISSEGSTTLGTQTIATNGGIGIEGSLAQMAVDLNFAIGDMRMQGKTQLQPFSKQPLGETQVYVRALNLAEFDRKLPRTAIDGELTISNISAQPAERTEGTKGTGWTVAFRFHNSLDDNGPLKALRGDGLVQFDAGNVNIPKLLLVAGDNRLNVHGALSQRGGKLFFSLAAPKLAQLGQGFSGTFRADGQVRGNIKQPHIEAAWQGNNLRVPGLLQIDATQGNLRFSPQPNAPIALSIRAEKIVTPQLRVKSFHARVQGVTSQHIIEASLTEEPRSTNLAGQRWTAAAQGALRDLDRTPRWQGNLTRFDAAGRFTARLTSSAALDVSQHHIQLDRFTLDAHGATLAVEHFTRNALGMVTRGRLERMQLAQLLTFAAPQPALQTDLQLAGEWNIRIGNTITGIVKLRRQSGDVVIQGGTPFAFGLTQLDANANVANNKLQLQFLAEGRQMGRISITAAVPIGNSKSPFAITPDAAMAGTAKIDMPSLAWVGPMASPTVSSAGRILADISLGGTYAQPDLSGRIAGDGLRVSIPDLGLDLRHGVLDSTFQRDTLTIGKLAFQSVEKSAEKGSDSPPAGNLVISGPIRFSGPDTHAQLALKVEHLALLNRSDRTLTMSGNGQLGWRNGRASATGQLTVDTGRFDIGRTDMPQLSDDVIVAGRNRKQPDRVAASVDIEIDFGNKLTISGRGLDAALAGKIRLNGEPNTPLRAQGIVQIARGSYTAYGRKLAIEEGMLRFGGALHNPALDIVAMRRGQEVEAGVAVRGTLLAPRVTLVSEPPVSEAEKLSWLVLGRSLDTATGNADIGALQSAASALLTDSAAAGVQSHIATAFGLDEFSIGTSQDNLQQRIVTLGKRLSSRLYVSYEQSLQTAASVVLLRYTLSPRLTVEAEAGTRSALSLFYNFAFD